MQTEVRRHAEYAALRATIRERGTARMLLIPFVFTAWAGVAIATSAVIAVALSTLVPLLVLAAGFEATFALYTNVERIGRYLQVFHEEGTGTLPPLADPPAWERVAMVFGKGIPGAAGHPLFAPVFGLATMVNYLAVVLPGPVLVEVAALTVPHMAFLAWLLVTDRAMRTQRAKELARFREIRDSGL
jgi:hypothetical protein